MKKIPRPLGDTLQRTLRGHGLAGRLEQLRGLQRHWAKAAPEWAEQSQLIGLRDGIATVVLTSPAAATRLRFEATRLAARLREAGLEEVREIRPRVSAPPSERPARSRSYSPEAADRLAAEAERITDPELRAALRRLAQRVHHPPEED
jgi:hypothetical protein